MKNLIKRIESDLAKDGYSIVIDPPSEYMDELLKRYSMKIKGYMDGDVFWEITGKETIL